MDLHHSARLSPDRVGSNVSSLPTMTSRVPGVGPSAPPIRRASMVATPWRGFWRGLFDGMASSTDRGCNFERVGPAIFTKQFMIDLVVEQSPSGQMEVIQGTQEYDIKANWKLLVENFSECFHCPPVHPELCRIVPAFRSMSSSIHW